MLLSTPRRLVPAFIALLMCCASGTHRWNPDAVIQDVLAHGYRFSGPQREIAIEEIAARDGVKSAATLRQIAAMERSLDPDRVLADLLAVEAALVALTQMHDADAVALNRLRFADDSIRGTVLINLIALKAWDMTSDVETWFATAPLRAERMHVIALAATFLSLSPRTTSASCTAVDRIRKTFPECLYTTTDYSCMNLDGSLIDLRRHLRCFDRN